MTTQLRKIAGSPMHSTADSVEAIGGIEEEWFFEGTATAYGLAGGATQYPTDGRWLAEPVDEAPFRSRMLVVRPRDPQQFNGTVIVQWNNVSAGESFIQGNRAAQMLEDGFAIVGVSAQRVGVEGPSAESAALGMATPSLKGDEPERYGDLQHPGDDFSYDIYTQAAQLARARPAARRRPARRPRGAAPAGHRRLAVGGPPGGVPQRRAADRVAVRRVPAPRVPERAVRAERGVGAR